MKKFILFLVAMFNIVALNAQTPKDKKIWDPIIEAIAYVESRHNPKAISKSGTYVGYLQMAPCVVKDVNRFLGEEKYTLKDRYNKEKSKEMFIIYQKRYNPEGDMHKAIRIWNGGPKGHLIKGTMNYYTRVMNRFNLTANN